MRDVTAINLPKTVLMETVGALRDYGQRGCEGLVLWVGGIHGRSASITAALVPPQQSINDENGVGYFLDSQTMFSINRLLSERQLRLLAQVHSHPGRAYHSRTDDLYAIVTTEGGLSLVVPDFAVGPVDLGHWATYRLRGGRWLELAAHEVLELVRVSHG